MALTDEALTDARERRQGFAEALRACGNDVAALVTDRGNVSYLTGHSSPSWENRSRPICLLLCAERTWLIASEDEAVRVSAWDETIEAVGYTEPTPSPESDSAVRSSYAATVVKAIIETLAPLSLSRIATEGAEPSANCLPAAAIEAIGGELEVETVDLEPIIWPLRLRKTVFEIGRIKDAATALGRTFEGFAGRAQPGMTERELAMEFTAACAHSGADRLAYLVVVAGQGHPMLGAPSDRVWAEGDLLAVDACVTCGPYWADFCRHYAAAEPTAEQSAAYARLVAGVNAGREAAAGGGKAADLAKAMSAALQADSTSFGRLGHGIGTDLAEPPSLHPTDDTTLTPGMVLCLEPSAYYEGVGALVAEEMVALNSDGIELLSPAFPTQLEVLA